MPAQAAPLDLGTPVPPAAQDAQSDVRRQLAKRLADVICIPASQLTPQERHMAGDVLVELMRDADVDLRKSVAKRLTMLNEAPRTILVILAKDDFEVAKHVLEDSVSLTDSDLIQISRKVSGAHRKVIAQRRKVSDAVSDTLVEFLEEDVVEALLKNKGAELSETAIQRILTVSRSHQPYVSLLVKREELRPSHGLTMFWWANAANRRKILHRFGVTRDVLQETCADLFEPAAKSGWEDAGVRKALQFIERRQRNRAAMERSQYGTLEAAIERAEIYGLDRSLTEEISYMAGIKPATGAQILTDKGGEGIAVLCKAPGLKREYVEKLWRAMKRPLVSMEGEMHDDLARVIECYDMMSTNKAQTVLRYWNWSLTSSLNAEVLRYIKRGVIPREEEFGIAAITAALVFSHRD
ncbi:DUF2336 domain-containing protein [Litorimonas sp. RW-G-Af-16]|uniref:DUF2336 domain-containing protein n=1 Tax=Litorimonas sp. RW-G-Af-16 TaxID=3241168 RepID=UPI003AABBABF